MLKQFEITKSEISKRLVRGKPVLRVELTPRRVIEQAPAQTNELELEAMGLGIELELVAFVA